MIGFSFSRRWRHQRVFDLLHDQDGELSVIFWRQMPSVRREHNQNIPLLIIDVMNHYKSPFEFILLNQPSDKCVSYVS